MELGCGLQLIGGVGLGDGGDLGEGYHGHVDGCCASDYSSGQQLTECAHQGLDDADLEREKGGMKKANIRGNSDEVGHARKGKVGKMLEFHNVSHANDSIA